MDILMKKYSLDSKLAEAYDDKNFKPEEDAEKLRYAMKGFIMINQKLIVDIITKRTNKQLQEIKLFYWYIFNRRLINDLQDALSENIKEIISALMVTPAEFNAFILRHALDTFNYRNLVEILLTQTNLELIQAKQAYKRLFVNNLEDDISLCTQNNLILQKFLKYLATSIKPLDSRVDLNLAHKDLHDICGSNELWFDEQRLVLILSSRSYDQLKAMFNEYKKISGHMFEEKLKNELSNNKLFLDCVISFIDLIIDRNSYFARLLHESSNVEIMKIIVSRHEKDLQYIIKKYNLLYNQSLNDHLKKNTTGNYQLALLNLIYNKTE